MCTVFWFLKTHISAPFSRIQTIVNGKTYLIYSKKNFSESITEAPNALSNTLAKVHVCPLVYMSNSRKMFEISYLPRSLVGILVSSLL